MKGKPLGVSLAVKAKPIDRIEVSASSIFLFSAFTSFLYIYVPNIVPVSPFCA
jgi:hypothetical protein